VSKKGFLGGSEWMDRGMRHERERERERGMRMEMEMEMAKERGMDE